MVSARRASTPGMCITSSHPRFPAVALREAIDNHTHALPCSVSVVIDRSFNSAYVSDTGPGIPRPDLAYHLRYTAAGGHHGFFIRWVGIGLYLSRGAVRSLGGDPLLESDPAFGTYLCEPLAGGSVSCGRTGRRRDAARPCPSPEQSSCSRKVRRQARPGRLPSSTRV